MTILVQDPNCKDCCIISQPVAKKTGLGFAVEVTEGHNLIRTRVGYFNTVYPADSMTESRLVLPAAGGTMQLPALKTLFVHVDQPISISLISAGELCVLTVNSMLFVDASYDSVTVVNNGTVDASVFVAYV